MSCNWSRAWLGFSCMGPVLQPCSRWRTVLPEWHFKGTMLSNAAFIMAALFSITLITCYFYYIGFIFKWAGQKCLFCSSEMTWFQRCFVIFICFTKDVIHWDLEWMFSLEAWHWEIAEYRLHIWSRPGFILWFVILGGKWIIPNIISRRTQAVAFLSALLFFWAAIKKSSFFLLFIWFCST